MGDKIESTLGRIADLLQHGLLREILPRGPRDVCGQHDRDKSGGESQDFRLPE